MSDEKPAAANSRSIPDYLLNLINEIAVREHFTNYTIETAAGSNLGDGFQSEMIRVCIKGQRKLQPDEISLICKIPPATDFRREQCKWSFRMEVLCYEKLLPAFEQFQQEKTVPLSHAFTSFPKCYGTYANEETNLYAIVLEDLRNSGYSMWNKFEQIDFAHATLAVQTIAKYHALSFAVRDQRPELFEQINKIQCQMLRSMKEAKSTRGFIDQALENAIDALNADDVELKAKMNYLQTTFEEQVKRCTDLDTAEPFGVLNHGDCWNNNMMFRYDDDDNTTAGEPPAKVVKSVCLIDWQGGQFSSPAYDLSYYLYSSTEQPLRDQHYDDLVSLYYDSLAGTLRALGSDPERLFTLADLQDQLQKFSVFGLLMAPMLVQVVTVTTNDLPNLDEWSEDGNFEFGLSDTYRVRMRDVIEDWVGRGYVL